MVGLQIGNQIFLGGIHLVAHLQKRNPQIFKLVDIPIDLHQVRIAQVKKV